MRLPQRGFHLHFIFDNNPSESDHQVLGLFREEIRNVDRVLKSLPKRIAPSINVPPQTNGLVESMLQWLYFWFIRLKRAGA